MSCKFVLVLVLLVSVSFAQEFQFLKEVAGAYVQSGELQISATEEKIIIDHPVSGKITQNLVGTKSIVASPSGAYFLLLNFAFTSKKTDYPIQVFLLSRKNGFEYKKTITAEFDMPHPIFAVDDEGMIYSFDPLAMRLTQDKNGKINDISLAHINTVEMEKTAFLKAGPDYVTGVTNILARDDEGENILAFHFSPKQNLLTTKKLAGSTVTGFDVRDNYGMISVNIETETGMVFQSYLFTGAIDQPVTIPLEFSHFILTIDKELLVNKNGFYEVKDASYTMKKGIPNAIKITRLCQLGTKNYLIAAVRTDGNKVFKFDNETGELINITQVSVDRNSRLEIFVNENNLFIIEDYKKTKIYNIN